jgi:hypothetical protein
VLHNFIDDLSENVFIYTSHGQAVNRMPIGTELTARVAARNSLDLYGLGK